jgi:hypothetical protein
MESGLKIWASLFSLLGILFIPFSFHLFDFYTDTLRWAIGSFSVKIPLYMGFTPTLKDLSSDSIGLYFLLATLLILSLTLTFFFRRRIGRENTERFCQLTYTIIAFYLSLILIKYGIDKLFKTQFNLPEPNLLYTPLGMLDKDILFWSTMGTSRAYNIFMGTLEIIPAVLLLFKKTRILGGMIATAVMINVVAINLSFDISVKLYSSFLLFLAIYISYPGLRPLYALFILQEKVNPEIIKHKFSNLKGYNWFKSIIILTILAEALYPYFKSGNFNDDKAPRPLLHGAYEVLFDSSNNNPSRIKRVFIHRDGYLIFQDEQDQMTDFKLEIDPLKNELLVSDYDGSSNVLQYSYKNKTKTLTLTLPFDAKSKIICKQLDHENLPLMQEQFHWTVD